MYENSIHSEIEEIFKLLHSECVYVCPAVPHFLSEVSRFLRQGDKWRNVQTLNDAAVDLDLRGFG